jgi:hypothetical protein
MKLYIGIEQPLTILVPCLQSHGGDQATVRSVCQ